MSFFEFTLAHRDSGSSARCGVIRTRAGAIQTPVFIPVGTQATVKTLHPDEVEATGARVILCNTYHLMLRPGVEVLQDAGGLHRFMGWDGPILTDSGGFQIFSLAQQAKVREEGVTFRSHIDGSPHTLTPESAVELQARFGSEIMMPLDHLVGLPAKARSIEDAAERTERWLERSVVAHYECEIATKGVLFGIAQGGMDRELRRRQAQLVAQAAVAGSAIGGLSVGELKEEMASMLEEICPLLPTNRPRYLMGVGSPEDLWDGVSLGVDMFDCVLPTRLARNGSVFTLDGRVDILKARYRHLHEAVDVECDCPTCARFTAAYLHHLFRSREVLGLRLATVHNLRFLARQMETMRTAIEESRFEAAHRSFDERYRPVVRASSDPLPVA